MESTMSIGSYKIPKRQFDNKQNHFNMTTTIKPASFKHLEPTRMRIDEIYPEYRYGWSAADNKFREFNYFPDTATAQSVFSGDEGTKSNDPAVRFHLREKFWDDGAKKFRFEKMGQLDGTFFKTYKKVFDVEVTLESDVSVPMWDKDKKAEVPEVIPAGTTVRLKALSSKKIQDIASSMMLTKGIEKVDMKKRDRTT